MMTYWRVWHTDEQNFWGHAETRCLLWQGPNLFVLLPYPRNEAQIMNCGWWTNAAYHSTQCQMLQASEATKKCLIIRACCNLASWPSANTSIVSKECRVYTLHHINCIGPSRSPWNGSWVWVATIQHFALQLIFQEASTEIQDMQSPVLACEKLKLRHLMLDLMWIVAKKSIWTSEQTYPQNPCLKSLKVQAKLKWST